jgi:hypothetical protein
MFYSTAGVHVSGTMLSMLNFNGTYICMPVYFYMALYSRRSAFARSIECYCIVWVASSTFAAC